MARSNLQIGIDVCQTNSCKAINLTDSTGQQSSTNTTGWGDGYSPNPNTETTFVTKTILEVTPPSGIVYTFDTSGLISAKDVLLFAAFPDITGATQFPLFAQDLGYSAGTALPDGIYEFNLTAECLIPGPAPVDYEEYAHLRVLLLCNAKCCVDKLFHIASAETNCSSCKTEKLNTALEAQAYLTNAEFAAACGKFNQALELLAKVQWICNTKNCNNC